MTDKPIYEELQQRVKELENQIVEGKLAGEAQRESEERFRAIFETAKDSIFIKDRHLRYTLVNPTMERLFGLSASQLLGKSDEELFGDEAGVHIREIDSCVLRGEIIEEEDTKPVSGVLTTFHVIKVPIRDNAGEIIGLCGIARDITKQNQAKEALKKAHEGLEQRVKERTAELSKINDQLIQEIEERKQKEEELRKYERIVDASNDHMSLTDRNYVYQLVNYAYLRSHKLKREDIIGHSVPELFGQEFFETHQKPMIDRCLADEVVRYQSWIDFLTLGRRYMDIAYYPYFEDDGSISGCVVNARDITESKQVEKALKESEGKLSAMLQSIGDHISMMDKDLNIIWANSIAKKIFGNDIVGKKCHEVYHRRKEPCEPYPCIVLKAFMDGGIHEHDMQVIDKDGKILSFHCTANVALKDKEGKPKAVIDISRDVTEEKLAQEEKAKLGAQLQQAKKMQAIGTLASGFAHNFNNLLMGIIANTSIMLLDIDSNHPHYRYLKNIEKQVKSGSKVAIQLTGYARVERYEFEPINMNQLLKETSVTFGIAKKKIRFHQIIAEKLHIIEADKEQIEQALLNLYINAVDAMPEGGDLFLKTMNVTDQDMIGKTYKLKPGKYILLTVRDTGIGMDKKTKERIFEPFFTTKDNIQSTGLGLSSTYNIIKAHGGYIDVDSEKGVGTTFSIYLPATKKEIKEKKEPSVEILKGNETILLVDDDDAVIEGCGEMLEKMGGRPEKGSSRTKNISRRRGR